MQFGIEQTAATNQKVEHFFALSQQLEPWSGKENTQVFAQAEGQINIKTSQRFPPAFDVESLPQTVAQYWQLKRAYNQTISSAVSVEPDLAPLVKNLTRETQPDLKERIVKFFSVFDES